MPLTQVVDYFNTHLETLNPRASLQRHAYFHYRAGRVSAELGGMSLQPFQQPILDLTTQAIAGWESKIRVVGQRHRRYSVEDLYFLAWDKEDVVFLDRFLRVLHALHHLSRHTVEAPPLVVDVHWRHIQAVEASHGLVFETLLARLGVSPGQMVLRLRGDLLLAEAHVQQAAHSFHQRGYILLAHELPSVVEESGWQTLKECGVHWVTPESQAFGDRRWHQQALATGLKVWWSGVEQPAELELAQHTGIVLVSGSLVEEFNMRVPVSAAF